VSLVAVAQVGDWLPDIGKAAAGSW
jgi:hypothetical protein